MERNEELLLRARIAELDGGAERGMLCFTRYLTPREQLLARSVRGSAHRFVWGGYPDAERRRIFFVPDYVGETGDDPQAEINALRTFFADEFDAAMTRLRITGSGFRTLNHRDYLGSVLALGITREVLGDIVVLNDYAAVLFCDEKIAAYLLTALERIGSDKVKVSLDSADTPLPPRATAPISDTIASPRLDCVVAALINLSRDKAQTMIRAGEVELNFAPEERTDAEVREGDMLSLRGYGRFVIRSIGGQTKRGRLRLSAAKYI